jgi:CheY-like chemotaxis protein
MESDPPGNLLVLLAEDNRVNQTVAIRVLMRMGVSLILAGTGHEVLALLAKHSVDLVLMDVQMPEMDGLMATRIIREGEQFTGRHVPIIAMTAYALRGDRERCLAAGMDEHLTKPINRQHLKEAMARVTSVRVLVSPTV